jgi:thiopeptide-type bacteriocin biosynthesis protein
LATQWRPAGFFVLRTPLFPFETLGELTDEAALGRIARLPAAREALFLASPSLEERARGWLDGDDDVVLGSLERPLLAYLTRMAARPTPFGLFASCTTGLVASSTDLRVNDDVRRRTRPDMDYLVALASRLEAEPPIRDGLTWRPNSSLYRAAGRVRLVETRLAGSARSHHLVAIEEDDALTAVLARAHDGATFGELAAVLVDDEITDDEAREYLAELVDAQVLASDLMPNVTGAEPLGPMITMLRAVPGGALVADELDRCRVVLEKLDVAGTGNDAEIYRAIGADLISLVPDADIGRLFQVDVFREGPAPTLGPRVMTEAARAVDLLARLAPAVDDKLASFRDAFVARYEDRKVPLVEALDEEAGIGFERSNDPAADEAPLLADLNLGASSHEPGQWTRRDDVLLELLSDALRSRATVIDLDEHTIAAFERTQDVGPVLPPTVSVMGRIAATSSEAVDAGDFQLFVQSVVGSSGAQLLGRFCHGDAQLSTATRDFVQEEERAQPERVFAEIVHLPEGRIGNILLRPLLRTHELVYLGRSGAPLDGQIPITDLLISVQADRVVLRSVRLAREVVPRLTSAHNTALRSLPTYRFLAALQTQGVYGGLAWSWGSLARAPFTPRVVSGRMVLARARWRLSRGDIESVAAGQMDRVRARIGLPRWVAVAEADNELVVDLHNPYAAACMVETVRGRTEVEILEVFPAPDELCARGPAGRFVHEVIMPLVATHPKIELASQQPTLSSPARAFAPGGEWLYAKLYTGTGTADSVLRDAIAPVVRTAKSNGAVDRWFFVRYADPDEHLRVRFHGPPDRLRTKVEKALHDALEPFLAIGAVWRVAFDTYEPELDRYGGPAGIELCEAAFSADSDAVIEIVAMLAGDTGLDARWRLCVAGINRLLDDFDFATETRAAWARERRDAYFTEFRGTPGLAKQLGNRWRLDGRDLLQLTDPTSCPEHPLGEGLVPWDHRSIMLRPIARELHSRADRGELTAAIGNLVASLAHMQAIRLLRSAARAQELVMYDLLARLYRSRLARPS